MDTISEKIRKLLALANSPNEHEATAAAELASSLALKYNIDLLALQTVDYKDNSVFDSTKTESWITNIISGLALINACKLYRQINADHSVSYRIVGRPAAVDVIKDLTAYLVSTVKRLNRQSVETYGFTSRQERQDYRKAFRLGASRRLYQRLSERFNELNKKDDALSPGTNALVVSNYFDEERKNIEEFLQNQKFKSTKAKSISLRSSIGYHDGARAANNISLGEQIHGVRNSRQVR